MSKMKTKLPKMIMTMIYHGNMGTGIVTVVISVKFDVVRLKPMVVTTKLRLAVVPVSETPVEIGKLLLGSIVVLPVKLVVFSTAVVSSVVLILEMMVALVMVTVSVIAVELDVSVLVVDLDSAVDDDAVV